MWNVTLGYTAIHFNDLGNSTGKSFPDLPHRPANVQIYDAVMVVVSRKLGRKYRTNRVLNPGPVVCFDCLEEFSRIILLMCCHSVNQETIWAFIALVHFFKRKVDIWHYIGPSKCKKDGCKIIWHYIGFPNFSGRNTFSLGQPIFFIQANVGIMVQYVQGRVHIIIIPAYRYSKTRKESVGSSSNFSVPT